MNVPMEGRENLRRGRDGAPSSGDSSFFRRRRHQPAFPSCRLPPARPPILGRPSGASSVGPWGGFFFLGSSVGRKMARVFEGPSVLRTGALSFVGAFAGWLAGAKYRRLPPSAARCTDRYGTWEKRPIPGSTADPSTGATPGPISHGSSAQRTRARIAHDAPDRTDGPTVTRTPDRDSYASLLRALGLGACPFSVTPPRFDHWKGNVRFVSACGEMRPMPCSVRCNVRGWGILPGWNSAVEFAEPRGAQTAGVLSPTTKKTKTKNPNLRIFNPLRHSLQKM